MATYETSRSGKRGEVIGEGSSRQIQCSTAYVALTTAMLDNANDDVGLFDVPAGAVITGILVKLTDVDAGTAAVIDIGDASDEDRLVAASTVGQAGGTVQTLATTGVLYKYTARTQIRMYVATAAGTPAAGTLSVALMYFVDPDHNQTALTAAIA